MGCETCDGTGEMLIGYPCVCPMCEGTGQMNHPQTEAKQMIRRSERVCVFFEAGNGEVLLWVTKQEALRLIDEYELTANDMDYVSGIGYVALKHEVANIHIHA